MQRFADFENLIIRVKFKRYLRRTLFSNTKYSIAQRRDS